MECKLLLKSLAALSFLPADDVKVVFGTLAQSFPDKESYNAVLIYFHCTYIEGAAGRTPMFPVKIWNHFYSAIEEFPKTTNCCEGFHNALNSMFHCSHPSVWYLFDGLQRDMALFFTKALMPVTILKYVSIFHCGHFSLWAFFRVGIFPCGHFSLWAFFPVDIFRCGHFSCGLFFVGIFPVGFFPVGILILRSPSCWFIWF